MAEWHFGSACSCDRLANDRGDFHGLLKIKTADDALASYRREYEREWPTVNNKMLTKTTREIAFFVSLAK